MSDDTQWRDKYRESLSRLSAEEVRRSRLQSVLRLLIGRLCLAGQGRDARLDDELRKVAATVRKGIEPQAIEELLEPLSQAVAALEAPAQAVQTAPEPRAAPSADPDSTLSTLDRLALLPELRPDHRAAARRCVRLSGYRRACESLGARDGHRERAARGGAARKDGT